MAIDSDPSNWITASIDSEPVIYTENSTPSVWIITKIDSEFLAEQNSDPTGWLITTIDATASLSGAFLVDSTDTLIPLDLDVFTDAIPALTPSTTLLTSDTLVPSGGGSTSGLLPSDVLTPSVTLLVNA